MSLATKGWARSDMNSQNKFSKRRITTKLIMASPEAKTCIILITGANQGIGYELAKKLAQDHACCHVLMGSRDTARGEQAATTLQQQGLSVEALWLDVTNDVSISEAEAYVDSEFGRLDVLVNNAGISNDKQLDKPGTSVREVFREQFDTNLFGVAQVTEVFAPLLKKSSTGARLVFTSSWMGSLAQRNDVSDRYYQSMLPVYRTSKAALNMLCLHYAMKHKDDGWKVNTVDPGHVATSLNNFQGPDNVEIGVLQLARMAMLEEDGPTATFSNRFGIVPW